MGEVHKAEKPSINFSKMIYTVDLMMIIILFLVEATGTIIILISQNFLNFAQNIHLINTGRDIHIL